MAETKSRGRGRPGQRKIKRGGLTGKYPKEYKAWHALVKRCTDREDEQWFRYGGRGVTVCAEWQGDGGFQAFIAHIGPCPNRELSVDRKDNDGNYEPGNVRWADSHTQNNNRRTSHYLTFGGETLTVRQWGERLRINEQTLHERLKRWSIEKTLTTPLKRKK